MNNLIGIYNELKERNRKIVMEGKLKIDDVLFQVGEDIDTRYCLAVSAIFQKKKSKINKYYFDLLNDIENIKGVHYYIENNNKLEGTAHFTLLQIIGFDQFNINEIKGREQEYVEIIKDELSKIVPFRIHFMNVVAFSSGLAILGYPTVNINTVRDNIRKRLNDNNLPLKEPYYNNIIHSTILRLIENIDHNQLINIMDKYNKSYFGFIEVNMDSFFIGYGTWKLNEYEIIEIKNK